MITPVFQSSDALASIAWFAPVDLAVKSVLILAAAGTVVFAMRRAPATARHLVWVLAVVATLALPLLSGLVPQWRVLPAWIGQYDSPATLPQVESKLAAPVVVTAPKDARPLIESVVPVVSGGPVNRNFADADSAVASSPPPTRIESPAVSPMLVMTPRHESVWPSVRRWATVVWAIGTAMFALPILISLFGLWRMGRRLPQVTDDDWKSLAGGLSAALRLSRAVTLLRGRPRAMPMTWGVLHPKLVLPPEAEEWCAQRRRVVLMHELAHIKRGDFVVQFIVQLARALYWFNPLMWVASRQIALESEGACDDLVLGSNTRPSDYAEHLLAIATGLKEGFFLSTAAVAMARSSRLKARLIGILDGRRNRKRLTVARIAMLGCLLTAVILPVAAMRSTHTIPWAQKRGWASQDVQPTTLTSSLGGWRNLPFSISKQEEADARTCIQLAKKSRETLNGQNQFARLETRTELEQILTTRHGYFYAEFLLGLWHQANGDAREADRWMELAYKDAPVVVVQRLVFEDQSPLANVIVQSFALECNRVENGSLDPSLELYYPNLRTDTSGCIYLPGYDTVFRTNSMATPEGYDVAWPKLGWFQTSAKVAVLPSAIVARGVQATALEVGDAAAAPTFGPVVERTMPAVEDGAASKGLNFDNDELLGLPADFSQMETRARENWLRGSKINLFFEFPKELQDWKMAGNNLNWSVVQPKSLDPIVEGDLWTQLSAKDLMHNYFQPHEVIMAQADKLMGALALNGLHPPVTIAFNTTHNAGLMQFTGFTENPRVVKIRYKLVQGITKPVAAVEKPAADGHAATQPTDARERFLAIERIARLPAAEQTAQIRHLYRDLAPPCMSLFTESILSSYPTNILDHDAKNGFNGNTALWAKQLAEAASNLSPEQVADKLEANLWINVAARARALQVLQANSIASLIQEDLTLASKESAQRACDVILGLKLPQFTDQVLKIYLAGGEAAEPANYILIFSHDRSVIKPLLAEVQKDPKQLIRLSPLFQGPLQGQPAEPALLKLLDSADPDVRVAAASALSECVDPALAKPVAKLAHENSPKLHQAALALATKLPDDAFQTARGDLLPLLQSGNHAVEFSAIRCFAQRKDMAAASATLKALNSDSADDGDAVTIMQALSALTGSTFGYDMHHWGPKHNEAALRKIEAALRNKGALIGQNHGADGAADLINLKGAWKVRSLQGMPVFRWRQAAVGEVIYIYNVSTLSATPTTPKDPPVLDYYTISPGGDPKEVDITFWVENLWQTGHGIYRLDGDTLTICVAPYNEQKRPTEFKPGTGTLIELVRVRPAEPKAALPATQPLDPGGAASPRAKLGDQTQKIMDALLADVDHVSIMLEHQPQEQPNRHSLVLSEAATPQPDFYLHPRVTNEQMKLLLAHLATDGYFDRAIGGPLPPRSSQEPPKVKNQPGYVLLVTLPASGKTPQYSFLVDLSLEAGADVRALKGLRSVLKGEATAAAATVLTEMGDPPPPPASQPTTRSTRERVRGTLAKRDGRSLVLSIESKGQPVRTLVVSTDDQTEFRVDGTEGTLESFQPGMTVDVTSLPGQYPQPDGGFRIPPRQLIWGFSKSLRGSVVRVEGNQLIILAKRGDAEPAEVTVATDAGTVVKVAGKTKGGPRTLYDGTLADVKPNLEIEVIPQTGPARIVRLYPKAEDAAEIKQTTAKLVRTQGRALVLVRDLPQSVEKEFSIQTDENTVFHLDTDPAKLEDLKPGMHLSITERSGKPGTPIVRSVAARSEGLSGVVIRVEGSGIIINARQPAGDFKEVVITTDEHTKFLALSRATPSGVRDITPGTIVSAVPSTGVATKLYVLPSPTGPFPGTRPARAPATQAATQRAQTAAPSSDAADVSDRTKLRGPWKIETIEGDASFGARQIQVGETIRVDRTSLQSVRPQRGWHDYYLVAPQKTPKEFDVTFWLVNLFQTQVGIYQLDGDKLTLCVASHQGVRPTKFIGEAGKSSLIVLTRVVPDPSPQPSIRLSGHVLDDATGQPITNFSIQGGRVDDNDPSKINWGYTLETLSKNPLGRFSTSVDWFGDWRCRIVASGYVSQPLVTEPPADNAEEIADIVIRLKRGRQVSGHLFDHTGKPVKDAGVYVVGNPPVNLTGGRAMELSGGFVEDNKVVRTATDADGAFAISGIGDDMQRIAVTSSAMDLWVVPAPMADTAPADFEIRLPPPGKLIVHYDIPGAPESAKLFMQLHTWDMNGWAGVSNARYDLIKRGTEFVLDNLAPGEYTIDRSKNNGLGPWDATLLDRRTVKIESGQTVVTDFVRTQGASITGQIIGLDQGEVAKAKPTRVYVRVIAPDAGQWPQVIYESLGMGPGDKPMDGNFKTELIPPGRYKVRAEVFIPETDAERHHTGIVPPAFVGETIVTVPEHGEVAFVKIELKRFVQ